jgi:hypothetical protein
MCRRICDGIRKRSSVRKLVVTENVTLDGVIDASEG